MLQLEQSLFQLPLLLRFASQAGLHCQLRICYKLAQMPLGENQHHLESRQME